MKLKKKLGMILLTGALTITAVGCSSSDNKEAENKSETSVEEKAENTSVEEKEEENVPTEYKSALIKAKTYSDTMGMSKAGLYDQLTSEYGEKFTEEAAQYAIDNIKADWKENALKKAKTYQESMAMSPSAIYDQLISEYGEKFTEEEAQYAIDNLE
ncbi:Ltp family lipoprotein [Paeniclostridium sordellii]|uniref:Ltp family lipoprotein n=1 Tax=Paraclostridium sordellii TaxID=1505 RepID=UPI00210AFF08|nr:Ltp family lipoprotein [Paeniclostridium sordellii]MCQ4696021.1 Ltp family lipoprotein [Paeniclostridium sordellii]